MNHSFELLKKGKKIKFLVYGQKEDPEGNKVIREEMGKRTIFYI
jgi:hypothetical protein